TTGTGAPAVRSPRLTRRRRFTDLGRVRVRALVRVPSPFFRAAGAPGTEHGPGPGLGPGHGWVPRAFPTCDTVAPALFPRFPRGCDPPPPMVERSARRGPRFDAR